ncbi:hypothetical protein [Haloarcula sp. H-GB5]|jgi:hypothetical protein
MVDTKQSNRRKFLRTTGGVMSVGLATSMAGCSALSGGDGNNSDSGSEADITGNINIGDSLQGTIEVVEHEDIINEQTNQVGAYVEIANSGDQNQSLNVLAEFFKNGEKVGEDKENSEMVPTDNNAKLRLGIAGTRDNIDRYDITIESVF